MKSLMLLLLTGLCGVIPVASAAPVDLCGWFDSYAYGDCVLFYTIVDCYAYGTELQAVPDSLLDGRIVRVRGDLIPCEDCCDPPVVLEAIAGAQITSCEPVDLGCGTLGRDGIEGEYCYHWHSPHNGDLSIFSLHGYAIGDTVRVTGVIIECQGSTCGLPILDLEEFYPCEQTPPGVDGTTWGSMKVLFR
jgi:hypothetical protein